MHNDKGLANSCLDSQNLLVKTTRRSTSNSDSCLLNNGNPASKLFIDELNDIS